MTTEAIAFSGQKSETDWVAANWLATRRSRKIAVCFIAIFSLAQCGLGWERIYAQPIAELIPLLAMILFWLCFVIFGSKFASKFVARRAWRNNKLMRLPVHGLISEVGIDYAVENVSTNKFVWEHFGHYREAEKLLLVFSAPNQFLFFSPKFFADDRDWQRFRAVVAGKLPSK